MYCYFGIFHSKCALSRLLVLCIALIECLLPQGPMSVQFGSDFTFIQNWQRLRTKLVRRRAVRLQTDSNSSLGSFILERKCHPFYILWYRVISIFSTHKLSTGGRNLFFSTYIIKFMSRDSSFGIMTRLWAEWSGFQGSISGRGWEFFSTVSTSDLGPTHPPIQWVLGGLFSWW
jgi:hypothetical protein